MFRAGLAECADLLHQLAETFKGEFGLKELLGNRFHLPIKWQILVISTRLPDIKLIYIVIM
jgi:hypothetical protein